MPQPEPFVSIVIPTYNREKLVQKAISSALAQSYRNLEVVVCDNCSTDATFAVVEEYMRRDPRVVGHRNAENLGPVRNWIKGIELSRGEFVQLLFSDDWLGPQAVERMLAPMLNDPDVGFCYSAVEIHEESPQQANQGLAGGPGGSVAAYQIGRARRMDSTEFLHLHFSGTGRAPVSPGCALFRRKDASRFIPTQLPPYNGFDVNRYGIGNDVTLYLRTCEQYPYCYYIDEPLIHFRSHPESFTLRLEGQTRNLPAWCYIHAYTLFMRQAKLKPLPKARLSWDLAYYKFRLRVLQALGALGRSLRPRATALLTVVLGSVLGSALCRPV